MKSLNQSVLYGVIGLLVGIIATNIFFSTRHDSYRQYDNGGRSSMHRMPDGSMMHNVGMGMDDMMQAMTLSLDGKTGYEFDQAFLSEMIVHHEGAVKMAQMVLTNSKNPELVKLANDIIKAQTGEIKMMQDWQKAWRK